MHTNQNFKEWYQNNYHKLTGYGLWLKGGEMNTLSPSEYDKRPYRVLISRLSTYTDVAPSFTHSLVYEIAASNSKIFPDLAYLPYEQDVRIFSKDNVPWLVGTQTKYGGKAFSMIAFSNSIIQELINIPVFLKNSSIPLAKSDRMNDPSVPLILMGGANALYSSSLWGEEPPVDGIFAGEDPGLIKEIFDTAADLSLAGKTKKEILEKLSSIQGFFEPDNVKATQKARKPKTHAINVPQSMVMTYDTDTMGEGFLEISHGCRAFCSFCSENWSRKPYSEEKPEDIVKKAVEEKKWSGLEKLNLSSFNFNLYTDIYKLIWELVPLFEDIGLKSQRFDILGEDPAMIEYQFAIGKNTFSCGLEGISPRLRKYLNKNLPDFSLINSFTHVFKYRPRELKVFLLSTGLEEEYDFKEFEKFLNFLKGQKEKHRAKTRVIFSITPLVRFPWTPLEFADACSESAHNKIMDRIKKDAETRGFEARHAMDSYEYMVSQILVRASSDRVRRALFKAVEEKEFVYYKKVSGEFFSCFLRCLEKEGLTREELLKGFTLEESEKKPWAAVGTGVERQVLWDTYLKNKEYSEIGESLSKIKITPSAQSVAELKNRVDLLKKSAEKISFSVDIEPERKGCPRKYTGLALARALMTACPMLTGYFRGFDSSRMCPDAEAPAWMTGYDVITLRFLKGAREVLQKALKDSSFIKTLNEHFGSFGKVLEATCQKTDLQYTIKITSAHEMNFNEYFLKRGVKFTLYKKTPETFYLEFTKDSFKKKLALSFSGDTSKGAVEFVPGEKFVIEEFLKEAYNFRNKSEWVRAQVRAMKM